jgi:hypothetical protein
MRVGAGLGGGQILALGFDIGFEFAVGDGEFGVGKVGERVVVFWGFGCVFGGMVACG